MSHTNGSQPKLRQHVFPSCACCIRHTVFLQLSTPLPATQTHSLSATQHTPSCNSVHPLLQLSTPPPATQDTPSCNSAHPSLQLRHTAFLQLSTPPPATQYTPSCNSAHPLLQLKTPPPATQHTPPCNSDTQPFCNSVHPLLQLSTPLPATQHTPPCNSAHPFLQLSTPPTATQHTPFCNSVHPLLQLSTPLPATQHSPSCNSAHPFLQLRHTPSCGAGSAQLVRRGDQDQGSADGQQRSDPLGTHLCQGEALPQLAGRCARLGRQPEPLLGNPPARLGLQRHGGDCGGWLCCRA